MVQVKTNKPKCVSVEMQPSKPETVDKVHENISLFPHQGGLGWCEPTPCTSFPWGNTFFSKCWEMFGRSVCWLCTLEPCKALLKVRGLPDRAAESDHWPPKYRRHKARVVVEVLRWKGSQRVGLWHAAAQPGSLCPQTRANKHKQLRKQLGRGPGKPICSLATKEEPSKYRGVCWGCCCNIVFIGSYFQDCNKNGLFVTYREATVCSEQKNNNSSDLLKWCFVKSLRAIIILPAVDSCVSNLSSENIV